jgi:hypothetical protein
MTAKEKAVELLIKYDELLTYLESKRKAKDCVLIAIDEIIKAIPESGYVINDDYWFDVKQEIENL